MRHLIANPGLLALAALSGFLLALPSHAAEGERPIETSNTETNRSSLAATQKADLIAPNTYPFYSPPQCARTEADIHFTIGTTNRHGQFEFLQPEKRHFRWQKRDYLVAIDNDIIGMGGESYTHAWLYIYNKAFKDWRCFQVSHFRCVGGLVAVFCSGGDRNLWRRRRH